MDSYGGDDGRDDIGWLEWENGKKNDLDEDDGMKQEVDSKGKAFHIEMNDLWLSWARQRWTRDANNRWSASLKL